MTRNLMMLCAFMLITGCKSGPPSPYTEQSAQQRNTPLASQLNSQAAELLAADPDKAERLLREALAHDLYFGPAHNNLGVIFLSRGDLYEASSEFEWARKLMPGHPDPRINLAIALERGGQVEEAILAYKAVLEIRPELDAAMVGLATTQLKHRRTDERTAELLERIARSGKDPVVTEWALSQRALLRAQAPFEP